MRRRPAGLAPALLLAILVAAARAAADHVIPPGNDDVIAEMLGRGQALPGNCTFTGGSIEPSFVVAQYACAGVPPVRLELHHREDDGGAIARTAQFAIVPRSEVPPALVARLEQMIAQAESRFSWSAPPTPVRATPPPVPPSPTLTTHGHVEGWLAVLLLALVLTAPLAVVLGVLWSGVAALLSPARRRALSYVAVFLAVVAAGAVSVVPDWSMQNDEERDFMLSALCVNGHGCPLVGNEMNQLRIKLGPLNRYLMILGQLVTPDPRLVLAAILLLHALAAAWLAAAGDRLLGAPYGLAAGLLFGLNPTLLGTMTGPSNGSWSSLFIVGGVVGAVRWVSGEARGLLLAVTCLAAAAQLHGTNLTLVPALLLAAVVWRPPMPPRLLLACLAVAVALYSSWLLYELQTDWSDFAAMSTGWMVSQGPSIAGRAGRVVPFLAGPLGLLLTVAGVRALLGGRHAPPPLQRTGAMVVLLLSLPLAGTLLAGGGWAPRYGVPMIAPAALAAAAGLRAFVDAMRGAAWSRRACTAAGVGAVVVALAAQMLWQGLPYVGAAVGPLSLTLAEQIEAVGILRQHGFGAADFESRVHGAAWNRWSGGHVYLGYWLNGVASHAAADQQVVIVDCADAPPSFATWQQALPPSRTASYRLVGYHPQLSPAIVELADGDGTWWSSRRALPFHGQMNHSGDSQMRALLDPLLAYPPEFANLRRDPQNRDPIQMRVRTTLSRGSEDRALVLLSSAGLPATLSIDGVVREPMESATVQGGRTRARYLMHAAERGRELPILVQLELPANPPMPPYVDLFEEPACEPADAG